VSQNVLYLDNDYTVTYLAERFTPTPAPAGYRAATGLVVLQARLCATSDLDAVAIHPTLTLTLVEDGTSGFYYGTFDGSDLTAHLLTYVGQTVFLILSHAQDLRVVQAVKVVDRRKVTDG
jgi:hypothetical protein